MYLFIHSRRKDHFGRFDVAVFVYKAQVFDPRSLTIQSLMLKPRSSISDRGLR